MNNFVIYFEAKFWEDSYNEDVTNSKALHLYHSEIKADDTRFLQLQKLQKEKHDVKKREKFKIELKQFSVRCRIV
jgi:hypothetical protein